MMKKSNIKRLALSVMAASLLVVSAVGVTYSWIDDVKLVEFQNDSVTDNNAPLKTGVDINANINITSKENTINLGNILSSSDTTYQYQENATSPTKNHIRYDTDPANTAKNPKWNSNNNSGINEKKGYFYESGGMHLSGCYSDGETFYFPQRADNTNTILGYRVGNKDDENVNYISFTAKVSSPDANIDFWFKQEPVVKVHGQDSPINHARYAITVDGQSHVYSNTGSAQTCNSAMDGLESVSGVRKTAVYTYNNKENTTASRGKNSNTLFSIKKGATVLMNVKIWMEDGFDANAVDIDFQLVSSWTDTRKIRILDRTTNNDGASWINNHSAKLYLTCPEILNAYAKEIYTSPTVANWSSISSNTQYSFASVAPFYELTLDSGSTDSYTANVPLAYNNEDLVLYRCSSSGWNNGEHTGKTGDYGVSYWNWWKTTLPNSYKDETYTLYGSSLDNVAKSEFPDVEENYKGYGTWGAVEEIKVYSHFYETDYATMSTDGVGSRLFVRDHSDEDTSKEIYTYVMYRANNNTDTPWRVYVPASSSKIQFYYHLGDTKATWGYKSWGGENPQRRPLKSTGLYQKNSTVYHFARHYGGNKGWGYWEGADTVYLIKSSFLSSSNTTAHAYMFDSVSGTVFLKVNSDWAADSAQFAAYFWKDSTNSGDVRMTKISSDTYMAVTPSGSWNKVMFKRYNADYSSLWNQTVDLDYNDNVNGRLYTLTGKDGNNYNGSWGDREKSPYSGETLTRLKNTSGADVSYTWDGGTKTAEVWKTGSPCVYGKIIFNNGYGGDNAAVGVNKTGNLNLFPGCFYQVDGSKWYGSLDDKGRDASETGGDDSGGGGGGTDQSGGTIAGYTQSTDFTVQIAGQTYNVKTNGTDFKVEVTMAEGANWTTFQKNGVNFGNEKSGQSYDAKDGMDLYLSNSYSNNVNIRTQSAGSFIISFKWENDNTIKITSTLKKS